ncbi:MAG: hypothetical protein ABIK36_00880 [Pseudomonadota bacterium]
MTTGDEPARSGGDFNRDLAAAAPVIWLCANLLLSLRGLWQGWPTVFAYDLPDSVAYYVYASMAAGIVQILFGLYVLGPAWRKSPRFAFWFTNWAILAIVVDIGFPVATLFIGDFVLTWMPWLIAAVSVAISVWTIWLVRRPQPATAATKAAEPAGPAPLGVVILNAVLGFVLGGAAGLGIGLLAGSAIVDWLDVSCFEGGCGYAAAAIGLLGLIIGAIAGPVFAIWRTRGRRKPA